MKVKGNQIPDASVDAGLSCIYSGARFTALDVQRAMSATGHDGVDYVRAADALLQRERIAKRIEYVGGRARSTGFWQIVGGAVQ